MGPAVPRMGGMRGKNPLRGQTPVHTSLGFLLASAVPAEAPGTQANRLPGQALL